jgi:hypothetical protein
LQIRNFRDTGHHRRNFAAWPDHRDPMFRQSGAKPLEADRARHDSIDHHRTVGKDCYEALQFESERSLLQKAPWQAFARMHPSVPNPGLWQAVCTRRFAGKISRQPPIWRASQESLATSNDASATRFRCRASAAAYLQLIENLMKVPFRCPDANRKFLGDLPIRKAEIDQAKRLDLL